MGNLAAALTQLRKEHEQAQNHVAQLVQAIAIIEGLESRNASTTNHATTPPTKYVMSAATRRKLSIAQKARWAAKKPVRPIAIAASVSPTRRTMSAAARRKIAAAQRARWAKFRSTSKKAA